jgi:D-proline reductase (dithiol) PrdB
VGLVQRAIEAAGITTITLSSIPDLTAAVSAPRIAAIEYPQGRPCGQPGDVEGQLAILQATLQALTDMDAPGQIEHLAFEWPESPRQARAQSHQAPPISAYLRRHPWLLPKLLMRDIPPHS